MNLLAGADVWLVAARLANEHLAVDLPIVRVRPDTAPYVLRNALVENDAKISTHVHEGKAPAGDYTNAMKRLAAGLPSDPICLTRGDDLGDTDIGAPSRVHTGYVVGTCD